MADNEAREQDERFTLLTLRYIWLKYNVTRLNKKSYKLPYVAAEHGLIHHIIQPANPSHECNPSQWQLRVSSRPRGTEVFRLGLRPTLMRSHNYAHRSCTALHLLHAQPYMWFTHTHSHSHTQSIFVFLLLMENGFLAPLYYAEMMDAV